MSDKVRGLLVYSVLGAITGLVLMVLPAALRYPSHSIFVLLFKSVKNLALLDVFLLFFAGFTWGLAKGWPRGIFAAFFQVALLPVFATIEIFKDPTSHNLWPLEFIMYGFMGGVGAFGAALGLVLKSSKIGARNTTAAK